MLRKKPKKETPKNFNVNSPIRLKKLSKYKDYFEGKLFVCDYYPESTKNTGIIKEVHSFYSHRTRSLRYSLRTYMFEINSMIRIIYNPAELEKLYLGKTCDTELSIKDSHLHVLFYDRKLIKR